MEDYEIKSDTEFNDQNKININEIHTFIDLDSENLFQIDIIKKNNLISINCINTYKDNNKTYSLELTNELILKYFSCNNIQFMNKLNIEPNKKLKLESDNNGILLCITLEGNLKKKFKLTLVGGKEEIHEKNIDKLNEQILIEELKEAKSAIKMLMEENKKLVLAKKTKTGWNREVFGKSFKDWGIFFLKGSAVTAGGFVLYSLLRKLNGYNFWMPTNVDDIKESGLNVDAMNLSVSHKLAEQKENFENVLNASDLDKKTRKNLKAEFVKQENARLDAYREQIKKHVSDEKLARGNRDLKALCEGNNLCASLANVTSSVWAANPAFELSSVNGTTKLIPISVNNATTINSTVTE